MSKRIHPVIGTPFVAFAAVAMLLASCGGGGSSKANNTTTTSTTRHVTTSSTSGRSTTTTATGTSQSLPPQSKATAEQQTQFLRDAAHGTWKGPSGTLQFKSDGTASFTIKNCSFFSRDGQPEVVTRLTNCKPSTSDGPLKIDQGTYTIGVNDSMSAAFGAYVDSSGKLHVAFGKVTFIGQSRSGAVVLRSGDTLTIEGNHCTLKSEYDNVAPINVDCEFVKKGRRVAFIWTPKDPDRPNETLEKEAYVYYADSGLLVSPELVPTVYTKQ
jgi:hypothetical protein